MRGFDPWLAAGAVIGAAGGVVFVWLGLPLPWLVGSMVAVAAARLSGLPVAASTWPRNAGIVVVGLAMGLYFTPATALVVLANAPLLLGCALLTLAIGGVLALLLARTGRVDMATAWFASLPGGAAEMAMMAVGQGGQAAPVAVSQLMRVVSIVILVPNLMTLAGLHAGELPPPLAFVPWGFGLLVLLGLAGALALVRGGLVAGWLLGPMAVSACLTATGHALSGVPGWMTALAQLAMGVQLGTAFDRATLRRCRRFIPAALLNAWMLMVGCGICGAGLALLLGKPLSALLLGTAPGGIGEMSLTASALGVDVALVVSLQVTRLALVALLVPVVFRLVHGKRREV